jgi:hypothetical protein
MTLDADLRIGDLTDDPAGPVQLEPKPVAPRTDLDLEVALAAPGHEQLHDLMLPESPATARRGRWDWVAIQRSLDRQPPLGGA